MADLLDTNVIVRCAIEYYRFTTFPGVWIWIDQALEQGTLVLIPEVRDELSSWGEPISSWLRERAVISVPDVLVDVTEARLRVGEATSMMDLHPDSVKQFLDKADADLIAYALAGGHRVVTFETRETSGKSSKRAKIPDVCDQLGVPSLNPFQMLEDHGAKFDLSR